MQIFLIGGGDTFDDYGQYISFLKNFEIDFERYRTQKRDWKARLPETLGPGYEVIAPSMPNKSNAQYEEWKIWFEKFVPYLDPKIVLVGHSLGGTFLAKYLSENTFDKKVIATFLVSAPFGNYDGEGDVVSAYSLASFALPGDMSRFHDQAGRIFLYHSKDDPVVPSNDAERFAAVLPGSTLKVFDGRKHLTQEEFPELIEDIRAIGDPR